MLYDIVKLKKCNYHVSGYGSVLNVHGEIEMEASIMSGADLNVGAVSLVKDSPPHKHCP